LEVKYLVNQGASVDSKDDKGNPVLYLATIYRNVELVKVLIFLGVTVNAKNADGLTALVIAVQNYGHPYVNLIARELLQACKQIPQSTIPNCLVLSNPPIEADEQTKEILGEGLFPD
jgi:ankyrin repeat protein